jgi:hypothetical protein
MAAPFNATRRNRNIERNRAWSEQLGKYHQVSTHARSAKITFLVEECKGKYIHTCSINDICHVLEHGAYEDWRGLKLFVFRQPTHKRSILFPARGRLHHSADCGSAGEGASFRGPAITLDAVNCDKPIEWTAALTPHDAAELDRLRADGHRIARDGRRYLISVTKESARSTQLYRALLHEIGHWIDFLRHSRPGESDDITNAYRARPQSEREAFAHRYAAETGARLSKFGIIPFYPL